MSHAGPLADIAARRARRVDLWRAVGVHCMDPLFTPARWLAAARRFSHTGAERAAVGAAWEAAAVAGEVPFGWADGSELSFLCRADDRRYAPSTTPPTRGVALAMAADPEGVGVVSRLAADLARFEWGWYGGRQCSAPTVRWTVGVVSSPGPPAYCDELRGMLATVGTPMHRAPSAASLTLSDADWGRRRHSRYFSNFSPGEWARLGREVLGAAEDFDDAHVLVALGWRGGPFAGSVDALFNPVDALLELWALGYGWFGWYGGRGAWEVLPEGCYLVAVRP